MPIAYANHFLIQYQPEGNFVIGVGQGMLPALIGSPQEIAHQASEIEFIPIRPLSRYAVSEAKIKELVAVMQAGLDNAEKVRQSIDPRGQEPPND